MADYIAQDTDFTLVANAIRTKTGDSGLLEWPSGFKTAIDNIVDTDCIKTVDPAPVVSVSDAAPLDAEDVLVNIEPVQSGSGDPSSDNVRPITGWTGAKVTRTGKNLLSNAVNSTTINGVTFTVNQDRSITVTTSGTATARANLFYTGQLHLPPENYYLSVGKTFSLGQCYFELQIWRAATQKNQYYNTDGRIGFSFSLNAGDYIKQMYFSVFTGESVNDTIYPQLEPGSTATVYEPYQGDTYDITFPAEAGTVYGGTLDVTNGVLTVEYGLLDFNASEWSLQSINSYGIANFGFYRVPYPFDYSFTGICNMLPYQATTIGNTQTEGYMIASASTVYIRIDSAKASTVNQFKSWATVNNLQLLLKLATPITYTLTPQQIALLRGNNTLWADNGDVTLKYFTTAFEDLAEEIGFADGGDY